MVISEIEYNFGAFSVGTNAGGGKFVELIPENQEEAQLIDGKVGEVKKVYFRGTRSWAGMPTDGGYTQEFISLCEHFGIEKTARAFMDWVEEKFNAQVEEIRKEEESWTKEGMKWKSKNSYLWREWKNGINVVLARFHYGISFTPESEWEKEGETKRLDPDLCFRKEHGVYKCKIMSDSKKYLWLVEKGGQVSVAYCPTAEEAKELTGIDGAAKKIRPGERPPGVKTRVKIDD